VNPTKGYDIEATSSAEIADLAFGSSFSRIRAFLLCVERSDIPQNRIVALQNFLPVNPAMGRLRISGMEWIGFGLV
jgi:hypothetical protein